MTPVTDLVPEPLLWSMAASGLSLVLLLSLAGWVCLAMWTED